MNGWLESEGLKLRRYFAQPAGRATGLPGLVLCHGFPVGPLDARQSATTFPELIDRIANEMGFAALTFTFRGCGESEGDFSLAGWQVDLKAAVVISSTNPGASRAAVAKLALKLRQAGGSIQSASIPGTDAAVAARGWSAT